MKGILNDPDFDCATRCEKNPVQREKMMSSLSFTKWRNPVFILTDQRAGSGERYTFFLFFSWRGNTFQSMIGSWRQEPIFFSNSSGIIVRSSRRVARYSSAHPHLVSFSFQAHTLQSKIFFFYPQCPIGECWKCRVPREKKNPNRVLLVESQSGTFNLDWKEEEFSSKW